jgi:hypothetical protein
MEKFDLKKARRDLYAPKAGVFELVDPPEIGFLMVDGSGDPNTAGSYREAVEALYATSYTVKFAARAQLGKDHAVAPLEGLWDAPDLADFHSRRKDNWLWTMMIAQPDWIDADLVAESIAVAAAKKDLPALPLLRFERFAEGRSVQTLHIGPYDDEGPLIARLHKGFLPEHGLAPRDRHHEIYLGDPRRAAPAKLRTILRQPVS